LVHDASGFEAPTVGNTEDYSLETLDEEQSSTHNLRIDPTVAQIKII
jgi:hypothetical protein